MSMHETKSSVHVAQLCGLKGLNACFKALTISQANLNTKEQWIQVAIVVYRFMKLHKRKVTTCLPCSHLSLMEFHESVHYYTYLNPLFFCVQISFKEMFCKI